MLPSSTARKYYKSQHIGKKECTQKRLHFAYSRCLHNLRPCENDVNELRDIDIRSNFQRCRDITNMFSSQRGSLVNFFILINLPVIPFINKYSFFYCICAEFKSHSRNGATRWYRRRKKLDAIIPSSNR